MLAKAHPLHPTPDEEMRKLQHKHAHEICGLVAHTKDRLVTFYLKIRHMYTIVLTI